MADMVTLVVDWMMGMVRKEVQAVQEASISPVGNWKERVAVLVDVMVRGCVKAIV